MLITILFIVLFNIIIYLLLNSDYGIGCVYSSLGLVIFVAIEWTFGCFFNYPVASISNSVSCVYLHQNQCKATITETSPVRNGDKQKRRNGDSCNITLL